MHFRISQLCTGVFLAIAAFGLNAADSSYVNIETDLRTGMELKTVAERAYENRENYWEHTPTDQRDGDDQALSAGEAVTEIHKAAMANPQSVDSHSLDVVFVTTAVIDAWPDCEDTFESVRAAVALMPERADEIIATVAVKRNCNCSNGGLWLDQRVEERLMPELRNFILESPYMCSCSQVAMFGGISGLPENREFKPDMSEQEKADLIRRMTERVQVITDRTAALQSRNGWDCGCTDINLAASMQGIEQDELRDGTYDLLAQKYAEEVGDRGLVVDAFGVVGLNPKSYWGEGATASRDNTLRRKPQVFRGDPLILDPFDPAQEYGGFGNGAFDGVGQHQINSVNVPTDVFLSEYVEGANATSLQRPVAERDPDQRNRALEIFNGSEETIDLGSGQYLLEIYGSGGETAPVVTPPVLVRKTISLQSDVTFDFDKSTIKADVNYQLRQVVQVLNDSELFSEILISGHTCDLGDDAYNLALSERRAQSVKELLQQSGLAGTNIRTEGLGEREPRVPNTSEANRGLNRRVDITYVTREDAQIETTVAQAEPGQPRRTDITYLAAVPAGVVVNVEDTTIDNTMVDGDYSKGGMDPRQVIGLNGAIEPGQTFVLAFNESDEVLTSKAQLVTAQLDFKPQETLVLRRLGGEMALYCRAQTYSYVTNYPPLPFIRYPVTSHSFLHGHDDMASPN